MTSVSPAVPDLDAERASRTADSIAALARAHTRDAAFFNAPAANTFSRRVALDLLAFADVFVVIGGGIGSAALYAHAAGVDLHWLRIVHTCCVAALFAYLFLRQFDFYDTRRIHDLPQSPVQLVASLAVAFLTLSGLAAPFGITQSHFWFWYACWLAASGLPLIAIHACANRMFAAMTKSGRFETRIAVYGAGTVSTRIAAVLADPSLGIRLEGVYDDRARPRAGQRIQGLNGGLDELVAAGRAGAIDQIVIALPQADEARTLEIVRRLEQIPVSLHIYTHIASDSLNAMPMHSVSSLGRVGLLDVKPKPLADWAPIVKACEDYAIAAVALVLALPVMALIAIAIKLDSPGPVLFRQRRHGLNRRIIEVLKFRTMRVQEDGAEVRQAERGDSRVTRLGRILRSTSLDELPQIVNVLCGEMSLVGPRPHALVHDDHYAEMLERYANRHQVKPGMTGLAQISGFRGPTETPEKMQARVECDLAYIHSWSLWLDLKIMALTVVRGFRHKNAL